MLAGKACTLKRKKGHSNYSHSVIRDVFTYLNIFIMLCDISGNPETAYEKVFGNAKYFSPSWNVFQQTFFFPHSGF